MQGGLTSTPNILFGFQIVVPGLEVAGRSDFSVSQLTCNVACLSNQKPKMQHDRQQHPCLESIWFYDTDKFTVDSTDNVVPYSLGFHWLWAYELQASLLILIWSLCSWSALTSCHQAQRVERKHCLLNQARCLSSEPHIAPSYWFTCRHPISTRHPRHPLWSWQWEVVRRLQPQEWGWTLNTTRCYCFQILKFHQAVWNRCKSRSRAGVSTWATSPWACERL